jgi:phosphopantothenoylcysteine decarboxylase/phosphopantothenate--cysteine ligase
MSKSITLIISGSIAAIKTPELIRQLKDKNIEVRVILTKAGSEFVSRGELESLSGQAISMELFDAKEKEEMWHIRFSRETDLIVVAPASANLMAKMAHGIADDMASATLLANNKRTLVAPAMNTQMWIHPATQRNVKQIQKDDALIIEPREGMLACGEVGQGRMAEPHDIVAAIEEQLSINHHALEGVTALVTSGPTYEPIDPVRFIGNRSSGKQGHAIAEALANAGANVTLVTGPTHLDDPARVNTKHVTTAEEMLKACEDALPADIAVCAAAVADWRVSEPSARKLKKANVGAVPELRLIENPDILAHIASHPNKRPPLVVGFAAETESLEENASAKLKRKYCVWILANDVSKGQGFDKDENQITLIQSDSENKWPLMSKKDIAQKLAQEIITYREAKHAKS